MGILIDSNTLIDVERGRIDLDARLRGRGPDEAFVSVITASEVLHGVHRATDEPIRSKRSTIVEALLSRLSLLPVDLAIARKHARIWADLESRGMMIGAHDLWLAATCLAHQLTMITANVREFERVPGLQIENWRTDRT